ncbi:hypothetical protein GQ53DRAFT_822393 [Thozetella sp. PMI_491]|nr:hypothetical protein GQ53DRAFT_822393 [Thozetella sp. PMI_491]
MAAPSGMTVKTLEGTFILNKTFSDSLDSVFTLVGVPSPILFATPTEMLSASKQQQSVPYIIRKILGMATVHLKPSVRPSTSSDSSPDSESAPLQITMESSVSKLGPFGVGPLRAAGVETTRTETRTLDNSEYERVEPVVGLIKGRYWISTAEAVADEPVDEFLKGTWGGGDGTNIEVIRASFKGNEKDVVRAYDAEHVWGFEKCADGEVRYQGRIFASRGGEKACAMQVYDFLC